MLAITVVGRKNPTMDCAAVALRLDAFQRDVLLRCLQDLVAEILEAECAGTRFVHDQEPQASNQNLPHSGCLQLLQAQGRKLPCRSGGACQTFRPSGPPHSPDHLANVPQSRLLVPPNVRSAGRLKDGALPSKFASPITESHLLPTACQKLSLLKAAHKILHFLYFVSNGAPTMASVVRYRCSRCCASAHRKQPCANKRMKPPYTRRTRVVASKICASFFANFF